MKKLIVILILAFCIPAQAGLRQIFPIEKKLEYGANIPVITSGTGQGQLIYWDTDSSTYIPTSTPSDNNDLISYWNSDANAVSWLTTSAELAGVISNETGSGALVFGTSPTLTTSAILSDGFTLGLGTGKGLIQFDDEITDFVSFSNCNVGIGTTPTTELDVNGVITATGGSSTDWNTAYGWGDHASGGYQTQGDVLDDLNTLGVNSADGEFLVGTGAGAFAWESGATARTSIGLGTGNNVEFTKLKISQPYGHSIGAASPGDGWGWYSAGSIFATSSYAIIWQTDASLYAVANNDNLQGVRITPSFFEGAYSGVTNTCLYIGSGVGVADWMIYGNIDIPSYFTGKIGVAVTPSEDIHAADTVRADVAFNLNGTDGISGTLILDDGTTEKITLVFTGGILTSRTIAATTGTVTADWTD